MQVNSQVSSFCYNHKVLVELLRRDDVRNFDFLLYPYSIHLQKTHLKPKTKIASVSRIFQSSRRVTIHSKNEKNFRKKFQ